MSLDLNDTGPSFVEYDLTELNERLAERAYEWVPAYFPRGIISENRRELRLANISGDGPRKEGSCVIGLRGEHAGENWDFQTEKGGSPLDTLFARYRALWARVIRQGYRNYRGSQAAGPTASGQPARSRQVGCGRAYSFGDIHLGCRCATAGNGYRGLPCISRRSAAADRRLAPL